MSYCLKAGFAFSGSSDIFVQNRDRVSYRVCSSIQLKDSKSNEFLSKTLDYSSDQRVISSFSVKPPNLDPVHAQPSICIAKSMRWWEKSLQPNMIEINSAQELVDSLLNAGDRLVIVNFYSPGCGGCKSLHPKICQFAETNPDAIFLKVNYEQHKAMCYALNVHVLPFFRFYRGADGRVCSFSCTNATIKKFKDALAKHGTERCSLGPAKGLNESELLALASIGQISKDFVQNPSKNNDKADELVPDSNKIGLTNGNSMVMA